MRDYILIHGLLPNNSPKSESEELHDVFFTFCYPLFSTGFTTFLACNFYGISWSAICFVYPFVFIKRVYSIRFAAEFTTVAPLPSIQAKPSRITLLPLLAVFHDVTTFYY